MSTGAVADLWISPLVRGGLWITARLGMTAVTRGVLSVRTVSGRILRVSGRAVHILWITARSRARGLWIRRWIPTKSLVHGLWITIVGLPHPLPAAPHPLARRGSPAICGFGPVV
ncbi:hypothetical protein GCM10009679_12890 [Saccharothrix algeriensis]|uniref:Uncharacterized protein n=1 Tax=Catellatospora bangladeshensis TaxID=310355 RepID=A0A8J3NHL1_9ACTN|nr:hypothetical protein Cba03nite_27060 [Catellatospora bangladeshensis]